jgi:thiol-disulfide isomerase/thioredoxin
MSYPHRRKAQFLLVMSLFLGMFFIYVKGGDAQTPSPPIHPVTIYLFWGDGCSHCARTKPYLESLQTKYPGVLLKAYEVYYEPDNQQIFIDMASKFGFEPSAVPTFFIGTFYSVGYSEELNPKIEAVIRECLQEGCPDAGVDNIPVGRAAEISSLPDSIMTPTQSISPVVTPSIDQTTPSPIAESPSHLLEIPVLGTIDLDMQSNGVSTALIALADGFNPCSLWVLSMLLTLTLHTGSRRKVLLIGLVFLTVTATIYALFIAGLFSVLKIIRFLGWIQVVIALIALVFGIVNIKDYFWYKEGFSFTIADEKKPGIFKRIRNILDASQSIGGLIGATVILAIGVSMVEFSCTAGFPVLWTNLLAAQDVSTAAFVWLLLLYMFIYQLDEMLIFLSAVITLKASRLEEKHGRFLKLVGGILMVTLAAVMVIDPGIMNSLVNSLAIFGFALVATFLVVTIHRWVLPRFGIRIGSEVFEPPSKTTPYVD